MNDTNKINIEVALVRKLIATQFPQWVDLAVKPVKHGGWDNRSFHLGEHMIVRLPSALAYAPQVEKEQRWLPKLAPYLPLSIPMPLAMGKSSEDYPLPWSVYRWLDGKIASLEYIANLGQFAKALAEFLLALQQVDAMGGPVAGAHNFYRGGPLSTYDAQTRQTIATLSDRLDVEAVTAVWDTALASIWQGAPVWVHGDVAVGNLLINHGRLSAVIDFGCVGIGDPACDLVIAWRLFDEASRNKFRAALSLDHATWARARGWALWKALITCDQKPDSKRQFLEVEKSWWVIEQVLAEHKRELR